MTVFVIIKVEPDIRGISLYASLEKELLHVKKPLWMN